MAQLRVYIGTYTHDNTQSRAEGIFVYRLDVQTGALEFDSVVANVMNPSFLTVSADRKHLYAVNELGKFEGHEGGGVSAFALDGATGELSFLNAQPTYDASPCYVSTDRAGKWAFVANYSGGNIDVLAISADGRLGAATVIQHHGDDPKHPQTAHAHSILLDPTEQFVLAADLGLDRVYLYRFDAASGHLTPHDPPWLPAAPGAGPRHMLFHPNDRWFYVLNELNSTIVAYTFDNERFSFNETQTISMLPADYTGRKWAADLHIAASGRFLYASNRAHDSIAMFSIDQATGQLSLVEIVSTGGVTPRNFGFDLTGRFLFAANQDSSTVVTFSVDQATGRLTPTGQVLQIPSPMCVQVVELPG